eukprot:209670-Hanusia_phi.AAC.2
MIETPQIAIASTLICVVVVSGSFEQLVHPLISSFLFVPKIVPPYGVNSGSPELLCVNLKGLLNPNSSGQTLSHTRMRHQLAFAAAVMAATALSSEKFRQFLEKDKQHLYLPMMEDRDENGMHRQKKR